MSIKIVRGTHERPVKYCGNMNIAGKYLNIYRHSSEKMQLCINLVSQTTYTSHEQYTYMFCEALPTIPPSTYYQLTHLLVGGITDKELWWDGHGGRMYMGEWECDSQ